MLDILEEIIIDEGAVIIHDSWVKGDICELTDNKELINFINNKNIVWD